MRAGGRGRGVLRSGLAAIVAAAVLAVLVWLHPNTEAAAFSIGIAATGLLTVALGSGPGLLATAVLGGGVWYFFTQPQHSFALTRGWDVVGLIGYLVASLLVVAIISQLRRARMHVRDALEEQRASQEQFRQIAEAIPQLVWINRSDGRYEYFNQRWHEYTGLTFSDAGRLDLGRLLVHPEDYPRTNERWRRSLATGEPFETEYRLRRAGNGPYRWFLGRALPLHDEGGTITRWFGTSTDIHDQKQIQAELESAKEQLEAADARKNEFLAVLSHELRSPLAPIRNSVYVMSRPGLSAEQAQRALLIIDRQVQHMAHLIDDLLDVSRIAKGKIQLHREVMDLNDVVYAAAEDLRDLFERGAIDLTLEVTPEPLSIDGDRTRIEQMVGNLLQNAAKFTPSGGRVSLSLARNDEGQAVIQVRDDGAGIPHDLLARIFEPFVQAQGTLDRTRGGLGLGLALVRGLAELHGGTVTASSDGPGRGSCFTIKLPLEARSRARPRVPPSPVLRTVHRVLIIEDNLDTALSLKEALELDGYEVAFALDGIEGLAKARTFIPDVVLCDIGLPNMDGYDVARAVREDAALRSTLLVALSGYALADDVARSREAGFDHHIAKPPSIEALERVLQATAQEGTVGV